jgi:cell division protein FtsB
VNLSLSAAGPRMNPCFRPHHGTMARSRRLKRRPLLMWLGGGLVFACVLALIVGLSNGVVNARRDIERLQQTRACLESEVAQLALHWNAVSSRRVVTERAQRELGLVTADLPGRVIVRRGDEPQADGSLWARAAGVLDGAGNLVQGAAAGEAAE